MMLEKGDRGHHCKYNGVDVWGRDLVGIAKYLNYISINNQEILNLPIGVCTLRHMLGPHTVAAVLFREILITNRSAGSSSS